MTTQRNTQQRYMNPTTQQFPIHYEDGTLVVYSNHCGEIFVENKKGKGRGGNARLRISTHGSDLDVWPSGGRFDSVREVRLCAV